MCVIQFKDVWEMYRIKFVANRKVSWDNFWALKGVSFQVKKGEFLGIIGENGAGKSTILKLIAGMLKPDRGEIKVRGEVSGLLELGAGFHLELTGRENICLNARLFGLDQNQIEEKYEQIVSFASLGRFIYAPVKCYSQGMFVRLAFSVAIHMQPDILLIDDILTVGDEYFQGKCIKKLFESKERGETVIVVTHSMSMLRRLCKRAILLKEGRIIKDDVTDRVTPLYSQTVGIKEGVGFLEKGPLNLVFNNGRLFLNWKNRLLTPNSGAYTTFLASNRWHSSLQADWEVDREEGNRLVAKGKFYQLALTVVWRLELADNFEVKWDIEMETQEPIDIREGCTNIMLVNEYTKWFTVQERGEFPFVDDSCKDWQELLSDNVFRKCVGVEARDTNEGKLPALALEHSDYKAVSYAQILNTDYFTNCRVLQYKALGLQNYSATQSDRFIYFSGKIILGIPDVDNYLKGLEDEFTLSYGKLKLIFEKGRGILSYNDLRLSKGFHLDTSLIANGRRYCSRLVQWEVSKEGSNKLIARGCWPDLAVIQIWEIEMNDESSFFWRVSMEVDDEVNIQQQRVQFMCSQDYTHYSSDYAAGGFPGKFLESEIDMAQRCIPDGSVTLLQRDGRLPVLSLSFSGDSNAFAKILNSDFYHKARILRIEEVVPEENVRVLPGKYPCFDVRANLKTDNQTDSVRDDYRLKSLVFSNGVNVENSTNMLQTENLKLIFDKGRGRIFCRGIELTKGLGLYTSVRSQGRWHDSYSKALWRLCEVGRKSTIKVVGKWLHLPLSQYWEIKLGQDNLFEFIVTMKIREEIEADRLQTNLMLSEEYLEWITDRANGPFPSFKKDADDDWQPIWSGDAGTQYIGVDVVEGLEGRPSLPAVRFHPRTISSDWYLNVVNSDIYHRGRVLQYLNPVRRTIPPGEYPYFCGIIPVLLKS